MLSDLLLAIVLFKYLMYNPVQQLIICDHLQKRDPQKS